MCSRRILPKAAARSWPRSSSSGGRPTRRLKIRTVSFTAYGQSYKGSTIINYDSRVVSDLKIPHFTTQEP